MYKSRLGYEEEIFGKKFLENNRNNISLIRKFSKAEFIKGEKIITLIIEKDLTNLEDMFNNCTTLYNFDELKYLNTSLCTNFSNMFKGVEMSNIEALKEWDVSNSTNFSGMFYDCKLL